LKLLARGGVVISVRGAAGGYRLAKPAVELSLADVVAAIDGELALVGCQGQIEPCARNHFCTTRRHWGPVNMAVQNALKHMSLAEMARPMPQSGASAAGVAAFTLGAAL
jgi:Rrf2 family protein